MTIWVTTIGSIGLGIISLLTPIRFLLNPIEDLAKINIISLGSCLLSLFFQIYYFHHLANMGDFSALQDTSMAVVYASVGLVLVVTVLNVVVYFQREKEQQV